MNCANLAVMNGQQAPTGRLTVSSRQSTRLDPSHTASMNMKRIVGQISAARINAMSNVAVALSTLPNSFCRSQAGVPTLLGGGFKGAISCWRTKVVLSAISHPFAQPDAGVIEVHRQARNE